MKFDFNWLKEISGYTGTANKLAEVLSMRSLETEVVQIEDFKNIIIAQVTKISSHPNADRLRVIELEAAGKKYGPIVCGAWNFDEKVKVALALPGAIIPHNQHDAEHKSFKLEKATIRGVESQGMICSGFELGLDEEKTGILILDDNAPLGENLARALTPKSTVLDISPPANRPDTISYLGVAKEISAITGSKHKFKYPNFNQSKYKPKILKVNISEKKLCQRYIAVRLTNIEVRQSPKFIQDRLLASGLRPINNVVDITNYVMLTIGQPLHAFDAAKVFGGISVRLAYLNEEIKTLDEVVRKLNKNMLVIADTKKPIAIAGVIGSHDSAVDDYTNEIILEAANFDAVSVRRTAKALGVRTDASWRYEKSLPIEFTNFAAAYAVDLLVKYSGAKPVEVKEAGIKTPKPRVVVLDPQDTNSLLGMEIKAVEQKRILTKFGFVVIGKNQFRVQVPTWRPDVSLWQDLVEEIGRYKNLNDIEASEPALTASQHLADRFGDIRDEVIDYLVGLGLTETRPYPFVSDFDLNKWEISPKNTVEVANPLSHEYKYLTPNLLINALKVAENNSRFFKAGNYFEIDKVFWQESEEIKEKNYLAMFAFDATKYPVAKLVGAFREFCRRLKINVKINQENESKASIEVHGKKIGNVETHPISKLKWVGLYLDFDEFIKNIGKLEYKEITKYPKIELDVSILVKKDITWSKVVNVVMSVSSDLIQSLNLVDVFEGKNLPLGKKSLTFRLVYQASDRTLIDDEINQIQDKILKALISKLNAQIRD